MPEIYFNIQSGEVVTYTDGSAQVQDDRPPHIVPLAPLIEAKELPFRTDHLTPPDTRDWQREHFIAFGKWVMQVLAGGTDEPVALHAYQLLRLRELGLGPSISGKFRSLFGRVNAFKLEIGSPIDPKHERSLYHSWTLADFVKHARSVARAVGGKPIDKDYDQFAATHGGPSYNIIWQRVGGVSKLNAHLGYPNIREWDNDDYVAWGVRVLRANPATGITRSVIEALSRRKRGPCLRTVTVHFDTLGEFQTQVEEALQLEEEYRKKSLEAKLRACDKMVASGQLEKAERELPFAQLLALSGKRRLIEQCAPNLQRYQKLELSALSRSFMPRLLAAMPAGTTAGDVESIALALGVFDDIWPIDEPLDYLHANLPPTAITIYGRRGTHKKQRH